MKHPKPKRKVKLSTIKKKAWDAFSFYIRKSNEKNGLIECYTCGRKKGIKLMSAGHAIGGRNNAVLFDERIVKPQCAGCNVFGRGQYQIFAYKLIKELGMGEYEKILFEARKSVKYKIDDYNRIFEKYRELIEEKLKAKEEEI